MIIWRNRPIAFDALGIAPSYFNNGGSLFSLPRTDMMECTSLSKVGSDTDSF
jgi:hypothetical protein